MNKNIILMATVLFASTSVMAQTSLLEAAGKQMAKDAVEAAAPGTTQAIESVNEAVDDAKALKNAAEKAPAAIEQGAQNVKEAAEQKVEQSSSQVEEAVNAAPEVADQAVDAAKRKAAEKASESIFDLLR